MKKIILMMIALVSLNACTSAPKFRPIDEKGVTCTQTEEQEALDQKTCLRVPSYSDPVKWHRVMPWESLGDMPDLP